MGCGKSREVQEIKIEEKPYNTIHNLNILIKESSLIDFEKSEIRVEKFNESDISFFDVGKEGEDAEAGIIRQGKVLEESIDTNLIKHILPKKLPPINHPPIPSTVSSKFTKSAPRNHVPNTNIIQELLPKDNKGFDFDYIQEHSSTVHHDKFIKKIMQELSIDNKL